MTTATQILAEDVIRNYYLRDIPAYATLHYVEGIIDALFVTGQITGDQADEYKAINEAIYETHKHDDNDE